MIPKIKVCGINNLDNLRQVLALQPDYIGHIFYSKSRRFLSEDILQTFSVVSYGQTRKVAVLVNPSISKIQILATSYGFKYFQIHGELPPSFYQELRKLNPLLKLIKACPIDGTFQIEALRSFEDFVDYFLFDTASPTYGGSGQSFNWQLLQGYQLDTPYFLSGGINPSNFEAAQAFAVSQANCYGLDLNSGYETRPGIKSIELLKAVL